MSFYKRHNKIRAYKHQLDFWTALESFIYELKPILYFAFATAILRTNFSLVMWIKVSAIYILLVTLYIGYSRMVYRGYV